MDLIDKEDVPRSEIGEQRRQIPLLLNRRPGSDANIDPHLVCDNPRKRGLPEPRRAVEQHMVERVSALFRRLDKNPQVFLHLVLADILRHRLRAERIFYVVVLLGHPRGKHSIFLKIQLCFTCPTSVV